MSDLRKKLITLLLMMVMFITLIPSQGLAYAEDGRPDEFAVTADEEASEQKEPDEKEESAEKEDQDTVRQEETIQQDTDADLPAENKEADEDPGNDGPVIIDVIERKIERLTPEEEMPEPEELYEGYLKMEAYGSRTRKTAGGKLKGANKGVYDYINAEIAKIAAGKRESTIIRYSADEILGGKNYWTASELGLGSLSDSYGNITETARKKCQDLGTVLNALMADNPYGLYWFDKTQHTYGVSFRCYLEQKGGEERLVVTGNGYIKLPVASAYSKEKKVGTYYFDTGIGQSSSAVVSKAQAIVDKYEGTGDRERLTEYGDEICQLVKYNYEAARRPDMDYGDPWQLIWVFDDDPDTNVVCEGYAKAFKFLCDLTEFSTSVDCIVVTGDMDGVGHMWNIVTPDDGNNYIVDVTNSDSGSRLVDSGVFMCRSPITDAYPSYHFRRSGISVRYTYDEDCMNLFYSNELMIPGDGNGHEALDDKARIFGNTRYETAVKVAEEYKGSSGKFENIIVADGRNFPDALSGGYLAKVRNAPILLVNPSEESKIVNYISKNIASDGTVFILGGTGAVSSEFENKVKAKEISAKRLGGSTRYDTNLAILKAAGVNAEDILVCSGNGYADSLSASAVGKPILLVGDTLTENQKSFLRGLNTKQIYLIGGTGAIITAVENGLKALDFKTKRLWGQTRYETSAAVAEEFFARATTVMLIYAKNFPDGLSGGPLAMMKNAPIILTDSGNTDAANAYVKEAGAVRSITLGGPLLISDGAVKAIMGR